MTYTHDWFSQHIPVWNEVLKIVKSPIHKVLEVGSYEGRSAVWFIENIFTNDQGHLYCIDHWQGSPEFSPDMTLGSEQRFDEHTTTALDNRPGIQLTKIKATSLFGLTQLIHSYTRFDVIYIDGSHEPHDAMTDLVLAYHLCRQGGLIVCDDYLFRWHDKEPEHCPKAGIDAVVNVFGSKLMPLANVPLNQMFLSKGKPT